MFWQNIKDLGKKKSLVHIMTLPDPFYDASVKFLMQYKVHSISDFFRRSIYIYSVIYRTFGYLLFVLRQLVIFIYRTIEWTQLTIYFSPPWLFFPERICTYFDSYLRNQFVAKYFSQRIFYRFFLDLSRWRKRKEVKMTVMDGGEILVIKRTIPV